MAQTGRTESSLPTQRCSKASSDSERQKQEATSTQVYTALFTEKVIRSCQDSRQDRSDCALAIAASVSSEPLNIRATSRTLCSAESFSIVETAFDVTGSIVLETR